MTERELFDTFVQLTLNTLAIREETKAVAEAAKEVGHDKEDIALIKKAAKLHATAEFEANKAANEALVAKYEALIG